MGKEENKTGIKFTALASDPLWLEKWKKNRTQLTENGWRVSYFDEVVSFNIDRSDERHSTFKKFVSIDDSKEGVMPMNTSNFKNRNAYNTYKTFIDELRHNGADVHVRTSIREYSDININTNAPQILRALEAIQPFDIPEIVDYKFYADRVTIVKFADGTYTKCEVQGEDKFDPDTGIIFCVVKKMLGAKGHERFNDILRKAHAAHEKVEADKQKAAEEKRARKEKAAQARAKKLKKEEERKRQAIDIQKQAYVEAIAEVATTKKPAAKKKVTKE